MDLLEQINDPHQLRMLERAQLPALASALRAFLIESVSKTGGHLASNLGTIELTIALHYVYNTPEDRLVWDVGHQTYAHKILTGRREGMARLRMLGGPSGFTKREESPYDTFIAGHASTSVSAALGMAMAAKRQEIDRRVVAIIGDGAMTGGMAFEALNNAGASNANLLVILNDNEMSISPNVGALNTYFAKLLSGRFYTTVKSSWMVVAGLLFAFMGVFVKLGGQYFSSAELVFYRSLVGLFVIYGMVRVRGQSLATPHVRSHVWRGLSGFIALMLFFHAITVLPLATAITLNYTSPLFLALLLTVIMKEPPQWWLIGAIMLGFIGVALLLNPTFHGSDLVAGLMGLLSGFFAGIAYMNVRQLGQLDEPEWRIVFYFTLICTIGAGAWMALHEFHAISWRSVPILIGLGATATLAQLAMTRAYRLGQPLVVGSLAYSTVVFASVLGILIWDENLSLGAWLAIALIIVSGILSTRVTILDTSDVKP